MLPLIGLIERQICTEMLLYPNLPYYMAVLYCMLDRTSRTFYMIGHGGEIYTVSYNPDAAEQYQLWSQGASPIIHSGFSVFTTRFSLQQEDLQSYTKEYIYSRNKRLVDSIAALAAEHDGKPEGLPFYLVAPYLFFNQSSAIAAHSEGHTAWVRYDHIKRSLKIKSFFNGKKYEVLASHDLAVAYQMPYKCNLLEFSEQVHKLFGEDWISRVGSGKCFPITYHIYKGPGAQD